MAENRDGGGDICVAAHNHLSAAQWQLLQALRLYEEGEDYLLRHHARRRS